MSVRDLTPWERERQDENFQINSMKMWQRKLQRCTDCGLRWHPYVMTLDHIDRKTFIKGRNAKKIGSQLKFNPIIFERSLNETETVCMNCHAVRELKRDANDPKVGHRWKDELVRYLKMLKRGALLEDIHLD